MTLSRRTFTQTLGGALAAPAPIRPNIVMIYADDLGYGDLGCYGHPTIRTPNLDRMAAEGMRFTQFYSAAPVCTPSRAALLTGRYPMRSGLTRVLFPNSNGGIQDSELTIAQALKGAGYRTGMAGKWHLGHLSQFLPVRHGFDSYFGLPYSNDMRPVAGPGAPGQKTHPPLPLIRNGEVIETEPDQSRLTERYTAEAARFIRESKGKPFFYYFAHTFPHVPLYASDRFRGKSKAGLYGDVVEEIDWSVGEVFKALRETGQDANTLVMFSSDNGPWLVKRELGGSAGLLREGKATTWDGGMREPCLARWPGRIRAGSITSAQTSTMDLFPTFAHLGGAKLAADLVLDGENILDVLEGRNPGKERVFFYWHHEELRAMRKGPWKLHTETTIAAVAPGKTTRLDTPALYNLEVDPSEKYDVAAENPGTAKELIALMERHKADLKPGPMQR